MKLENNMKPIVVDEMAQYECLDIEKGYLDKCIPLVNFLETYQGEGPNCGKKMVLARYKFCNKLCPFCDTQHTTRDIVPMLYSLKDVSVLLKSSPNLMITGGEPSLNNVPREGELSQLESTVFMVRHLNYGFLDIETNGFNMPVLLNECDCVANEQGKNINISWSPKFVNDGDSEANYKTLQHLINYSAYTVKPIIKVVIGDDMEEYEEFIYKAVTKYGFDPNRIYLMPKGITYDEIQHSMEHVLDVGRDLSCNVSSRLHVLHNFK